jgi:hypothetical protein
MYIAGFFGSLRCPPALEFCEHEHTSAVLMTEMDPQLEWVLWGLLAGAVAVVVVVYCVCYKKIDARVRFCCGLNQDGALFAKVLANSQGRRSPAGWTLTVFGAVWLLAGLGLVGFGLYTLVPGTELLWDTQSRQVPLMLGAGGAITVLAAVSVHGAWKRVPSITLICYFYAVLVMLVVMCFFAIVPFVLGDVFERVVEQVWPTLKGSFPDTWQLYNGTAALAAATAELEAHLGLCVMGGLFVLASMLAGLVCSYLNLTAHVITRNFEMVTNVAFLALGLFAVYHGAKQLAGLSFEIKLAALTAAAFLAFTGLVGTLAACCSKHEGSFKFYAAVGIFNSGVQLAAGAVLLYFGGALWLDAGVRLESTFCATVYEDSAVCSCDNGSPTACPDTVCATTNVTCGEQEAAWEQAHAVTIFGLDVCNLHFLPDPTTTDPAATTAAAAAATNSSTATTATTTTTERAGTDFSGVYTCNQTETYFSTTPPLIPGTVVEFLQAQNLTQLLELSDRYSPHEYESAEERLAGLDRKAVLGFVELDVLLFACMLLLAFFFQIMLLVTNALIIKWNHDNDHPHGKDPYWRRLHVGFHRRKAVAKVQAAAAFKKAGRRALGFREIKVAPEDLDRVHRWTVRMKLQPEAFGEGVWGLGMSFAERQLEDDLRGYDGRKIVEVSGFRTGEDDDGIEVMSPGLAAGLKVGDRVLQIDGHEIFGGVKEFSLEVGQAKYLEEVELLVERVTRRRARTAKSDKKAGEAQGALFADEEAGQLPPVTADGNLLGMDGWEPELTTVEVAGASNAEPVGLNLSEVFGSGNEGYGVDKAYLTVNSVRPGSLGDRAGIRAHDTIVAVNGNLVFSTAEFVAGVRDNARGDGGPPRVLLHRVRRDDGPRPSLAQQQYNVQLRLDPERMGGLGIGARLIEVGAMMWRPDVPESRHASTFVMVNKLIGYADGSGRAGPAESAGLRQFDLVVRVDGDEVYTIVQLVTALKEKKSATLTIRRAARTGRDDDERKAAAAATPAKPMNAWD